MKALAIAVFAAVLVSASSATVFAHGGGLDANRCHTDHKTGIYHCH